MRETIYRIPGAPRLALLTDLHNRTFDAAIHCVEMHRPQIICIAGDILYGVWPKDDKSPLETQENVMPFLSACANLAPTFLSLGNHEQALDDADIQSITDTGVTVLDNSYVTLQIAEKRVVLGGLTSGYVMDYRKARNASGSSSVHYPKKESIDGLEGLRTASERIPDTSWLTDFTAEDGLKILLCHHPEYFPLIPTSVDLVLSGHTHGGQWRFYDPVVHQWRGVFAPGQGMWPTYSRGLYERDRLVVSAGLSNTSWIPRFFNPREVVFVED